MTNIEKLVRNGLMATLALSLVACSNTDNEVEAPTTYAPTFKAHIGNKMEEIKAGIVEDNENYKTEGEKFYWSASDGVIINYNPEDEDMYTQSLIYGATNIDPVNRNRCDLTSFFPVNITPGNYAVKAFYPSTRWHNQDSQYTVEMPRYFYRTNVDSEYMGDYLYMTAENDNLSIINGDESSDLNFTNQVAVFRVRLNIYESFFSRYYDWENKTIENYLERVTISIRDYGTSPIYNIPYRKFPTKAEYKNGRLVPVDGYTTDSLSVIVHSEQMGIHGKNFENKVKALPQQIDPNDNTIYYVVDFFIPMLPFEYDFGPNDEFKLSLQYKEVGSQGYRGRNHTCFWMTEFEHMAKGFKAGYSYFTTTDLK